MAMQSIEAGKEVPQVLLAWGMPSGDRAGSGLFEDAVLWCGAGAALLVWTALALVLTSG
jgi:hypothetical protein